MAMKGAALREEEYVDVATLFGFAADKVPELAKDIGGIQRPVIASPKGASFDIGRVLDEDKEKIPLQTVRPLFVRSNFQEEDEFADVLDLGKSVDRALNEVASRGRDAALVFVEARGFPAAYRIVGRYRVDGEKVTVSIRLLKGKKKVASFSVEGARGKTGALGERIVTEARACLK